MQQLDQLASKLGVTENALKVWCRRNGIEVTDQLNQYNIKLICLGYSVSNSNRKIETVQAARKILKDIEKAEEAPAPAPAPPEIIETPAQQPATPVQRKKGRVFLMCVFVSVLVWQMFHTALLEHSISPFGGSLGFILSAVFAFGVQFTGLLLTVYKANKKFLLMYLVIDLVINLLVYFPSEVAAKVVLSVVAALAIYSYSELFINKK